MGSSRGVGASLYRFLVDVQARGPQEALRLFNLEPLAGRPIQEILLSLAEYVCPTGGSVDEGTLARPSSRQSAISRRSEFMISTG
jgi:hypothetical protein